MWNALKGTQDPAGGWDTFLVVLKEDPGRGSKALWRGYAYGSGMKGQRKITRSPEVPKGGKGGRLREGQLKGVPRSAAVLGDCSADSFAS